MIVMVVVVDISKDLNLKQTYICRELFVYRAVVGCLLVKINKVYEIALMDLEGREGRDRTSSMQLLK